MDYEDFLGNDYQATVMEPFVDFLLIAYGKRDSTSEREKQMRFLQIKRLMKHSHSPRKMRTMTMTRRTSRRTMRTTTKRTMRTTTRSTTRRTTRRMTRTTTRTTIRNPRAKALMPGKSAKSIYEHEHEANIA